MFHYTHLVIGMLLVTINWCKATGTQSSQQVTKTYQVYDQNRGKLTQIFDGLNVQFRILKSVYGDERGRVNFKLLQVIESLITTMEVERKMESALDGDVAVVVGAVLDSIARDACAYLTIEVSSWYKDFNCSEEQLTDIANGIRFFLTVREAKKAVTKVAYNEDNNLSFSINYECDYWNSHVLKNCSIYDNNNVAGAGGPEVLAVEQSELVKNLKYVQRTVLQTDLLCEGESALCQA